MDKINEYLNRTRNIKRYPDGSGFEGLRPPMKCKDGFEISVQASRYHYCSPRVTGAYKYDAVELGFPNEEDDLIIDYAEDSAHPTDTVYGFVPIEIVNKLVEKHGGIVD